MLEVVVAISILAVGLLGVAALLAQLSRTTTSSRYTGTEITLASEKLEDLNKATKGTLTVGGDLTADVSVAGVAFFDDIQISSENGGVQDAVTGAAPGAPSNDMLQFHRRWLVESNTPLTGVERLTVVVIPRTGSSLDLAQSFQATLVRP